MAHLIGSQRVPLFINRIRMSRLWLFSSLNYFFSAPCYLKTAFLLANHNREIFSCISIISHVITIVLKCQLFVQFTWCCHFTVNNSSIQDWLHSLGGQSSTSLFTDHLSNFGCSKNTVRWRKCAHMATFHLEQTFIFDLFFSWHTRTENYAT